MPKSYLNAEPYGVGELIARKKHLKVPPNQRDYAWGTDEVSQFLEDLFSAVDTDTDEYFLGLIVIVGPIDGAWLVLDGQQRIATCTMVLAAIRFWLRQFARAEDADQIQRQFISVRKLGGTEEPRLLMNRTNNEIFTTLIQPELNIEELESLKQIQTSGTSNDKLISAFVACRDEIGKKIDQLDMSARDAFLYRLSDFIENQSQVVCLEVDQAADAYKIFESLNDRGMALSALDLVKNFAFGVVPESQHAELSKSWDEMASQIVDADAEDFLKVAWTARFGRVQRGALYSLIRKEHTTPESVLELVDMLANQAYLYTALLEPAHNAWIEYGPECAGSIAVLRDLRSRQIRPILLASMHQSIEVNRMDTLLKNLITLTVRYQTIGRRRTGLLEIACAKAARDLFSSTDLSSDPSKYLVPLIPSDSEFLNDISRYKEKNTKRAVHILLGIESFLRHGTYRPSWVQERIGSEDLVLVPLLSRRRESNQTNIDDPDPALSEDLTNRLGNLFILNRAEARALKSNNAQDAIEVLCGSEFLTSSKAFGVQKPTDWGRHEIVERQRTLGSAATQVWKWEHR